MDFPSLASNFDVYITNFNMNSVLPKLPEVRNTKAKNFSFKTNLCKLLFD